MLINIVMTSHDTGAVINHTLDISAPKTQIEKITYRRARAIARDHHGLNRVAVSAKPEAETAASLQAAITTAKALGEHCTASRLQRRLDKLTSHSEYGGWYAMLAAWQTKTSKAVH